MKKSCFSYNNYDNSHKNNNLVNSNCNCYRYVVGTPGPTGATGATGPTAWLFKSSIYIKLKSSI